MPPPRKLCLLIVAASHNPPFRHAATSQALLAHCRGFAVYKQIRKISFMSKLLSIFSVFVYAWLMLRAKKGAVIKRLL